MQELNQTAHKLLDAAENYTQTRGFNAFSYKDLQADVGVKTSSIHYYFPTKQDLAFAMTERYIENFRVQLSDMSSNHKHGLKQLEALGDLYIDVVKSGKFCMCGMLASDMLALPDNVTELLNHFFSMLENWIVTALELAQSQDQLRLKDDSKTAAKHLLAVLEGGMLIARTRNDPNYLKTVYHHALDSL